jgi:hypothetical protein
VLCELDFFALQKQSCPAVPLGLTGRNERHMTNLIRLSKTFGLWRGALQAMDNPANTNQEKRVVCDSHCSLAALLVWCSHWRAGNLARLFY